jgi:hypothetical protein
MSDPSATETAVDEASEPEDEGDVESHIGAPMDPTYLERLNEGTS